MICAVFYTLRYKSKTFVIYGSQRVVTSDGLMGFGDILIEDFGAVVLFIGYTVYMSGIKQYQQEGATEIDLHFIRCPTFHKMT